MKIAMCVNCGGLVVDGKQKYHHLKRCMGYKKEDIDYLRCKECGYKTPNLTRHIPIHGINTDAYRIKYPNMPLVIESIVEKRAKAILAKGGYKPVSEKRGAMQCLICNEWYQYETSQAHREKCIMIHPDKYELNKNYVKCPECHGIFLRLGKHLKDIHGWNKDRIVLEVGLGLQLMVQY
jgi:Zn finger protein HypA/HybF involved in hydrogenase expression